MGKTKRFFSIATFGIAFFSSFTALCPKVHAQDLNDDRTILDREEYDGEHPWHQLAPSRWSMSLRGAFAKFPSSSAIGGSDQFLIEWVLPFQKTGLFSVGGHLGTLPLTAPDSIVIQRSFYPNTTAGFQLRYQLKIAPSQWFVPTLSAEWDYIRIKALQTGYDQLTNSVIGFSAGFFLDLGLIDPSTASSAYQSLGLTKTYLTAEIHPLSITTPIFNLSGSLWYFGIRTEFE